MKVKDAISLMAKNPAVDFPWQVSLCTLINSFLPEDRQLDPRTAEAVEFQTALDGLEASTQQMLYESSIGPAAALQESGIGHRQEPIDMNSRQSVFLVFGLTICVCAALLYNGVGGEGGVETGDLIEIIKLLMSFLSPPQAV